MRKTGTASIATLAVLLLSGCATNPHADAGKRLMAENKPEQAKVEFEQALQAEPNNLEARAALARAREQLAAQRCLEGDNLRIDGKFEAAEAAFKRALDAVPNYPRASQGLRQVDADRRHATLLEEAGKRLKANDIAAAESNLRTILAQNPMHAQARQRLKDIERMRADGNPQPPASSFAKPVTLEFRDTPIRSVFEILSRTSGINFVFDREVRPDIKVTIFMRNSPVQEIVKLLLTTNQLSSKPLNANSVLVFPNTPAKLKEYQDLVTKSFYLSNTDVKQAQALVKQIIKTPDVFIDEKLNMLVVKDTAEAVRLTEKLLDSLDMAEPEVMLEVEVLEVSRNKLLELGVQFPDQVGYGRLTPDLTNSAITGTGIISSSTTLGGELAPGNVDLRNRSGLTSYVANPALLLNLKDTDGSSRLLANPRIRVKNREKAKILIGDKIPVFTTTSTANVGVSASVNYLDVGLKLEVEPRVSLDNDVSIKVGLEVSSIGKEVAGPAGSLAYQIGTRSADTNLRLRDGETQVLAGLINDEERSSASRLPGLGDIPGVGRLFSTQRDVNNKTEIVLLITPRIVRNLVRPEVVEPAIPAGTSNSVGEAPLTLKPTAPGNVSLSATGGPLTSSQLMRRQPRSEDAEVPTEPAPEAPSPEPQAVAPPQLDPTRNE